MDALVKDTFKEYRPTNWLPNGHLQTIYSTILDTSNIDRVDYRRHTLSLKDAGSISLDFNNPGKSKVLVICHGLTGGSHESYVRTVISQVADDTTSVVVNFRGCANTTVTSPLLYSGGQTNDLRSALLYIKNCYPDAELIGMGFSLGANVLTKYIGEEGDRCPFKAAISLANPWNLLKGSEQLESSYMGHYLYNRAMGKSLKKLMNAHEHAVKDVYADDLARLASFKWPTIRDFDNTITRKLGGHPPHFPFPSAEAYYAWYVASSTGYLHNIKIPVLGLNAEDDPIVSKEAWPEAADECKSSPSDIYKCKVNPLVEIYHTKYGGHLAWFEGGSPVSTFVKGPNYRDNYPPPRRWFAKPIARVVERLFTKEFASAPGSNIMPVKSTDENVEWETDDKEHIKYVGYSLVTKDEIIHGGEESQHIRCKDGPPPPEEDFSQIALNERVKHSSWKARLSAYTELIDHFKKSASDDDPIFKPWLSDVELLRKFVTDTNAAAQDKGIEALTELLKQSGQNAASLSSELSKPTIEKGFNASRPATKLKAIELSLSFVEVEGTADTVISSIIESLAAKQPKLVATCVTALKELVSQFGFKPISNTKPLLKSLTKIFGHSDKTVRSEGTLLTQSIYTYLGQSLFPLLEELKPVQVKELKEGFEKLDSEGKGAGTGKPTRLTRKAQAEVDNAVGGEGPAEEAIDVDNGADLGFDPNEDIPPVDVVASLNPEFYTLIESKKWQERKEVIDQLLETLNKAPKVEPSSDYSDLINALAKHISELNINVVIGAAQVLEKLGKGLPAPTFAGFKNTISKPLFERLKERKATVADALGGALDAMFSATGFAEFMDDITTYAKHKNPQVKQGTLSFLVRALKNTKLPPTLSEQKEIGSICTTTLEDSFEPVRAASAESLGTLMKIVGERAMNPIIEGLDGQRKSKVMEFYEKAEVKAKPGFKPKGVPAPAAKPVPAKPAPATAPKKPAAVPAKPKVPSPPAPSDDFDDFAKPASPAKPTSRGPPSRLLAKKPPSVAQPTAKPAPAPVPTASSSKPKSTGGVAPSEQPKFSMSAEDAEAKATEVIPETLVNQLGDSNWKERLQGMEDLHKWCIDDQNHQQLSCEVLFRFLSKKPGWSEKNFQVSAKQFALLGVLAENSESFNRACASLAIGPLVEKLGDMKLKKPAGDTLTVFSEKTSHQFVLSQGYEAMTKIKAPKAQADALLFVQQLLTEFGITGLALKDLIEFLKTGLKSANAMVRTNATKTLVTLKLFVGSDIRSFLDDLNPQLLSTIDSEFGKVEGQEPPEPIRSCADAAKPAAGGPSNGGSAPAGGDALDDLFPRQNLDKLIPAGTVAGSKSDAWKTRKEALEALLGVLDVKQNSRLQPNMNPDLGSALKGRLGDQNKIVQGMALTIIQKIALGMGKPFEKYVKTFVQGVAGIASDQKANVRAAAIATLDAMATACEGIDLLVSPLSTALESPNPTLRSNVLEWLNVFLAEKIPPSRSTDLAPLASPVISSLEDRNGDVRKNAQALLPYIIASAGYDFVESKTDKLKPAAKNTVLPILQSAKGIAKPAAAPVPPKTAAPMPAPGPATSAPTRPKVPGSIRPPPTAGPGTPIKAKPTAMPPPAADASSIRPPGSMRSRFGALSRSTAAPAPEEDEGGFGIKAKVPMKKPSTSSIASTSATQTSKSQSTYPFTSSDLMSKRQRAVKDGNARFTLGGDAGIRPEQIDYLEHQSQPFLSTQLHNLLFSTDHHAESDYLAGLAIINDAIQDAFGDSDNYGLGVEKSRQFILANVDIILKYVTLRLFDNNTSILLRTLEVIESTLKVVDEVNAQLTDYEANAFLPTLIVKSGDGKEPVRVRIRGILRLLGRSYPPSKVFNQLIDHGTTCKNSRTRSESIDELGSIINRHGMGVLTSNKALKIIGASLSDRDSSVRNSVLNTLVEVYKLVGDQVWSMVGDLPPKEKSMMEERLKRQPERGSAIPAKAAVGSKIAQRPSSSLSKLSQPSTFRAESPSRPDSRSSSRASSRTVNRPQSPAVDSPRKAIPTSKIGGVRGIRPPSQLGRTSTLPQPSSGLPQPSAGSALPQPSNSSASQSIKDNTSRPTSLTSTKSAFSSLSNLNNDPPTDPIAGILSNEPDRSVDSLKVIQRKLESPTEDLVRQADRLVTNITTQMFNTFEALREDMVPNVFRLAKHLIQTLNATVDSPTIAATLSSDSIRLLLEELTTRLLQTADSPSLKDLSRFINMLLLRLFTHGDLTAIFSALFDLLSAATINLHDLRVKNESPEAKLPELVLKCVWKTARNVKDDLQAERLDASVLLYTLEQFLQKIPPAEWRSRAADEIALGDMPLRTVKTIIQSLVYEKLDLVSNPEDSIVYTYLYRLLNRGPPSANDGGIGLGIKNVPTASSNGSELQASQTSQEEYEVNERLRRIFDKISESTTNKEGIADLYTFQKEHPEKQPRIEKQLSDLGEVFNSYIKRVLQRLAGEDAERASITSPALTQSGEYFISHDDKSDHLSIAQLDSAPVPQSPGVAVPRSRSSLSSQHEHRTSLDEKNLNRISTLFGSKPQSLYTPETEAPTVFSQTENYRHTINENEDVF
ncbi:ARM repeat-containing protein [Wallemia mellicola]|uniref:ARM repeat-containing protein n=1 Tax=Wallemia mellicola TaxID=1708541 RepID=A0A4T0QL86_9BASI|nr:ARM repeat-containing protein [Wallemia mellicola]